MIRHWSQLVPNMSADRCSCPSKFSHCCFRSTETVRTITRNGEPRTATSTFTQLLSSDQSERTTKKKKNVNGSCSLTLTRPLLAYIRKAEIDVWVLSNLQLETERPNRFRRPVDGFDQTFSSGPRKQNSGQSRPCPFK